MIAGMPTGTPSATSGASRHGAFLRHHLWRLVFAGTGGLTVTGPLPAGPAVLVVNHSSHADTAALMAAIPPAGKPVFAAAADYWFARRVRRFLVTTLAAAVPVERHADGAYAALRRAAAPVMAAGGIVIVYPEGTRTIDGSIGEFASGAVRLADDLDVPLVPAALLGTRDMLPKNGRFRALPVEVRFEQPFHSEGLARDRDTAEDVSGLLRDVVVALKEQTPVADPRSPLGEAVGRLVDSPAGLAGAFAWGFAEAVSWPVIAEMYFAFVAVTRPRRILPSAVALTAGTVCGVVTTAALTRRGLQVPAPMTTPRMSAAAAADLSTGVWGLRRQLFSGIPIKVYAAQAGAAGLPLGQLAAATGALRLARNVGVAAGATAVSSVLRAPVRRRYGAYVVATAAVWWVAERKVLRHWS